MSNCLTKYGSVSYLAGNVPRNELVKNRIFVLFFGDSPPAFLLLPLTYMANKAVGVPYLKTGGIGTLGIGLALSVTVLIRKCTRLSGCDSAKKKRNTIFDP